MLRYTLITLFLLMLVACSVTEQTSERSEDTPPTPPATTDPVDATGAAMAAQLRQIAGRNAEQDARTASAAGDIRLWAYHTRGGKIVPGVDHIAESWPVQIAPGMSDVIFGEEHSAARRQFLDYAARYNKMIMLLQAR